MNEFTTASARGLFDYDLNDRTRNKGAKLIVKHLNTSSANTFIIIYHDFLPPPRRGSHVKSDNTHTQSSDTPLSTYT